MGGESSSTSVMVYRALDRKSSIENEPRTLNINQIQFAREAALSVLSTTSIEEALRIFTENEKWHMDILKPSELVKWIVRFRSEILLMNKKRAKDEPGSAEDGPGSTKAKLEVLSMPTGQLWQSVDAGIAGDTPERSGSAHTSS
nr:uncharacterized protein LOC109146497 isoform X1 [Ipomoea batatas]GMC98773.1 uncharacterized protein LOC109146497 isoform X1 [Ipomoea batatas]